MFKRMLKPLESDSFFLIGARGVGKTSLIRELFAQKNVFWIDLLRPQEEERYQFDPAILEQDILALSQKPEWVVIDEIQRAPKLLDLAHYLIEHPDNKKKS